MKGLRLLFLLLLFSQYTYSQLITLDDEHLQYRILSNQVGIFKDTTNKIGLEELLQSPADYTFLQEGPEEQFSYDIHSTYWLRFQLKNLSSPGHHWLLEIVDARFNEVIFYSPQNLDAITTYSESKTGMQHDFEQREYQHKNFVFDIPLLSSENVSAYYYIKIKPGTIGSFLFKIRQNKAFVSYAFKEYVLLGMYYGMVLIMAFYNLFLYFTTREKVYVYYFLYALGWALDSAIHDGFGFQFVWSQNQFIAVWDAYLFKVFLLCSYLIYSQTFLDTSKQHPAWRKYTYLLFFLLLATEPFFPYIKHLYLYELTVFLYTLCMAAVIYRSGYKPARFLIVGNSIILLGIVLKLINNAAWFNFTLNNSALGIIVFVYARNISMILDILILSFAMGDRIRFLKQTNETAQAEIIKQLHENKLLSDRANNELEAKVIERTRIIEEKNALLQTQAEEIHEMNTILDRDNWKLKKHVIQEKEARLSLKQISYADFRLVYPSEQAINAFLEDLKWAQGYTCKKCGSQKYGKGAIPLSRRCSNCRYDESLTAYTAFHKCKFDLSKALYIAVLINRYGENIFITDISKELELRNATCWKFAQKLLETVHHKEYEKVKDEDKLKYLILNS